MSPNHTSAPSYWSKHGVRDLLYFCLIVFICTLIESTAVRTIVLPHLIPQLHAGQGFMAGSDSLGYHELALDLAEKIRIEGWSAWSLRPGRLATPVGVASAIYALFGSNPLFLLPFNALVHALAATFLLLIMRLIFSNYSKAISIIATVPFIIFPTAISWTSQLLKDGIFLLGAFAYFSVWLIIINKNFSFFHKLLYVAVVSIFSALTIMAARSYMIEVFIAFTILLTILAVFLTHLHYFRADAGTTQRFQLMTVISLGALQVLILVSIFRPHEQSYLRTNQAISEKFSTRQTSSCVDQLTNGCVGNSSSSSPQPQMSPAQTFKDLERPNTRCVSRWGEATIVPPFVNRIVKSIIMTREGFFADTYKSNGSTIDTDICLNSLYDVLNYLPRALQLGLLAPFPSDWFKLNSHGGGASRKLAGIEMTITYVALLGLGCFAYRLRRSREFWMSSCFAIAMITLISLVTPNLGALHRLRYGFLLLLVGLGVGLIAKHIFYRNQRQ
jgi:hypothetical protein